MTLLEMLKRDIARISFDVKTLADTIEAIECEEKIAEDAPPAVADRHLECLSRNVPEGYDTVLGYLARHAPEVLDLMDYSDPEATTRDGFWLAHRHKEVQYVPAPPVLRKRGLLRVRCWPVELLAQRFH